LAADDVQRGAVVWWRCQIKASISEEERREKNVNLAPILCVACLPLKEKNRSKKRQRTSVSRKKMNPE